MYVTREHVSLVIVCAYSKYSVQVRQKGDLEDTCLYLFSASHFPILPEAQFCMEISACWCLSRFTSKYSDISRRKNTYTCVRKRRLKKRNTCLT